MATAPASACISAVTGTGIVTIAISAITAKSNADF